MSDQKINLKLSNAKGRSSLRLVCWLQIDVRLSSPILALLCFAAVGCEPSERARLRAYDQRELQCIQQFRTGGIETAKHALITHLRLVADAESSGLRIQKTAWTKALCAARLSLIYRRLGDTALADRYLHEATADARVDAQQEGNKSWVAQPDEQLAAMLIDAVKKLDQNTNPEWRTN